MRTTFKDPKLQAQLDREGYVILDLLDAKEVEGLRGEYRESEHGMGKAAFFSSMMGGDPSAKKRVAQAIWEVLGEKVAPYFDEHRWVYGSYLVKHQSPDGQLGEVALHQDCSMTDEDRYQAINVWCPLLDTGADNGNLQVVPGSHRLNSKPRSFGAAFAYPHLNEVLRERYLRTLALSAGQALVYSMKLFHASPPSRNTEARLVACGVFIPKEAQLRYYRRDFQNDSGIEVFAVDANYYLEAPFFSRPDEHKYPLLTELPVEADPLSPEDLEAQLSPPSPISHP